MDLPAPFSPTIAWTVPRRTEKVMSLLATTPGEALGDPLELDGWGTTLGRGLRQRWGGSDGSHSWSGPATSRARWRNSGASGKGRGAGCGVRQASTRPGSDATAPPGPCVAHMLDTVRVDQGVTGTLILPEMILAL